MIIAISGKKQTGKDTIAKMLLYLIAWDKNEKNEIFPTECNYNSFKNWKDKLKLTFTESYINEGYAYNLCGWKIKKFASPLKQFISILTGCDINKLENEEFKNSYIPKEWINVKYRDMMKSIGAIMRKYFCEYTWINGLFKDYKKGDNWIISDLRYKNEAEYLLEKGAILIRINRNLNEHDSSDSECNLDNYSKFHYIINNENNDLEDLFKKVKEIYNKIKNKL